MKNILILLVAVLVVSCGGGGGGTAPAGGARGFTDYGPYYNLVPRSWAGVDENGTLLVFQFFDDFPHGESSVTLVAPAFTGGNLDQGSWMRTSKSVDLVSQEYPIGGMFSELTVDLHVVDPSLNELAAFSGGFNSERSILLEQVPPVEAGYELIQGQALLFPFGEEFPAGFTQFESQYNYTFTDFWFDNWNEPGGAGTAVQFERASSLCQGGQCGSIEVTFKESGAEVLVNGVVLGDTVWLYLPGNRVESGKLVDANTLVMDSGVTMVRENPI